MKLGNLKNYNTSNYDYWILKLMYTKYLQQIENNIFTVNIPLTLAKNLVL